MENIPYRMGKGHLHSIWAVSQSEILTSYSLDKLQKYLGTTSQKRHLEGFLSA